MRYEIIELVYDNSIEVLMTTSSFIYAKKYLNFLNFLYGDFRCFILKDRLEGVYYE